MRSRPKKNVISRIIAQARSQWPALRGGPFAVAVALLGITSLALLNAVSEEFVSSIFGDAPAAMSSAPKDGSASSRQADGRERLVRAPPVSIEAVQYRDTPWFKLPERLNDKPIYEAANLGVLSNECGGECYRGVDSRLRYFEYQYQDSQGQLLDRVPLEQFCALPRVEAIFSAFQAPGRRVLRHIGASAEPRRASELVGKLRPLYDEEHGSSGSKSWTDVEDAVANVMWNYVLEGREPEIGPTHGNFAYWWKGDVPNSAEGRAKQVLESFGNRFSPGEFAALPVTLVARNQVDRPQTILGTAIELTAYGEYPDAVTGGGGSIDIELPKAVPSSGVDRFDIGKMLVKSRVQNGVIQGASYFADPLSLPAHGMLRRELVLQNNSTGFLVWRAGIILAGQQVVWGPERCHYVPWLALRE